MTPTTVNSGLSWSANRNNRHGPFEAPLIDMSFTSYTGGNARQLGWTTSDAYVAMSYVAVQTGTITSISTTKMEKAGSPTDNVICEAFTDNAGNPSTTSLGVSDAVSAATLPASSGTTVTFTFSTPISVTAGTTYWFVFTRTGAIDVTNFIRVIVSTTSQNAAVQFKRANSSRVWGIISANDDLHLSVTYSGTALFGVFIDAVGNTVEVWRSADGGTTWTEQDAANHQAISATAANKVVDAIQDGTLIHFLYPGSTLWSIGTFNTVTNKFETSSAGSGPTVTVGISSTAAVGYLAKRGTDFIVFHHGLTNTIMSTIYRRTYYSRYSGGTWTLNTAVDGYGSVTANHADARAIAIDTTGRVYFFLTNPTAGTSLVRTLTPANALNTIQTVHASASGYASFSYAIGEAVSVPLTTEKIAISSYGSTGNTQPLIYSADVSNTPSSWATTAIQTGMTVNAGNGGIALALDGTTLYAYYGNLTDGDDLYYAKGSIGTAFSAQTEFQDAITLAGVNAEKISNAIGIFYNNNGTVTYDSLTLSTTVPLSVNDSGTLSVSESFSALIIQNVSLSDSPTVSATEAIAIAATQSVTDSDTASVTESIAISTTGTTLTDTDTASVTEAIAIASTVSFTDSGTASVTESLTVLTTVAVNLTDSGTVGAAEALSSAATLPLSDTGTLSPVEALSASTTLPLADSGTLGVTESFNAVTTVFVNLSDSGTVGSATTFVSAATLPLSETNTIGDSESLSYTTTVAVALSDSPTISVTETFADAATMALSDSGTFSIAESLTAVTTTFVNLSDSGTLGSVENLTASTTMGLTETITINAAESASITGTGGISISDSGTLSVLETLTASNTQTLSESNTLGSTETLAIAVSITYTDSGTVTGTEAFAIAGTLSLTDTGTIGVSESFVTATTATVSLSDSGTVGSTATLTSASTMSLTDAPTITSTQTLSSLTATPLSDNVTVLESESLTISTGVTQSDSSTLAIIESQSLSSTMAITDSDAVSVTESMTVSSAQPMSDTGTVGVVESFVVMTFLALSDNISVSAQEDVDVEGAVSLFDVAILSVAETVDVAIGINIFARIGGLLRTTPDSLAPMMAKLDPDDPLFLSTSSLSTIMVVTKETTEAPIAQHISSPTFSSIQVTTSSPMPPVLMSQETDDIV